jgi:transposase
MLCAPKLSTRSKAREIRPAMKKIRTGATKQTKNFREQKLTIGLDLGDRSSWYCVLDEAGEVLLEQKLSTSPKGDERSIWEEAAEPDCIGNGNAFSVAEPGLSELGHEIIVARAATKRKQCECGARRPRLCAGPECRRA